jgi:hypothetical protein
MKGKVFEMSLTELPEYKKYRVGICSSRDGQFDKFLNKLELGR